MNGVVDEYGRALLTLKVHSISNKQPFEITAWVNTAFNGELVVPRALIESMELVQSAGIRAHLADGNEVTLESYSCVINWFGDRKSVEVIANNGELPLLGIGLLNLHRLVVDYKERNVTLN